MDLVIRGRSQDHREQGHGTRGGPEWSQAGQDHGAREDQSGARQDRTIKRGGRSRWVRERRRQQLSSSVHQREPEAQGRVAAAAEWPSLTQQQFQNKPARDERVGQGAQVF